MNKRIYTEEEQEIIAKILLTEKGKQMTLRFLIEYHNSQKK